MPGALANLRILDFSRVLAGPLATMVLGDLGAEVTKVERPGSGDDTRSWGPPFDAAGTATYFHSVNRNKRSVAWDLSREEDRARARELARSSDVVVENFRPGFMDAAGLGYEQLSERNPGLVYCSITGFGREGGAALPGYDLLVQATGGLMSITGEQDGPPEKVGVAIVDVVCGLYAAIGILAALEHRGATGAGQRVEVDLMSSLLAALVNQGTAHTVAGVTPVRLGNRHPSVAPYEPVRCLDGECIVAVGTDRQFAALAGALGAPSLAADPRFATNVARVENREALTSALAPLFASLPRSEAIARLTAARVPAGVVNDIAEAYRFASDLGLEPTVEMRAADGTALTLTRSPIRLSATPVSYREPPPPLPEREAQRSPRRAGSPPSG